MNSRLFGVAKKLLSFIDIMALIQEFEKYSDFPELLFLAYVFL